METLFLALAILSVAVTYGADVFFAFVGRRALQLSNEASLANVMGRIHEVADQRMPIVGVIGLVSTLLVAIFSTNVLAWLAVVALVIHLLIYTIISKPVNAQLVRAVKQGTVLANTKQLQRRWDSVIVYRALLLTAALLSLVIVALIG
jgi:Domain of unknown function (DUF1772)